MIDQRPAISPEIIDNTFQLAPETLEALRDAIGHEDAKAIRSLTKEMHAADLAECISLFSSEQRVVLIEAIRRSFEAEVLVDLEPDVKDEVVEILGPEKAASVISQLELDDAIQVMEDLGEDEQQAILGAIPQQDREILEETLAYPEDAAARIMSDQFVALPQNWTVGKTIDFLRKTEKLPDDFYTIYVIDRHKRPVGSVLVSRVIRSKREVEIKDIMEDTLHVVNAETDQEEVAYMFRKYALASAPVINDSGVMIGVIIVNDIVTVMEEEAEEDILRLGGVSAATDLYSSSMQTALQRSPWLFINLLTAIAASAVIALFDESIEKLVALAVLMPIVASMAGNAGTQTLTVAVRGIATKELTPTNAMRVLMKEIGASVFNGLVFAVVVGVTCWFYYDSLYLSMIFALATAVSLIVAAFAGAVIPLGLVRVGVDPAVASGVFLTTVTDISAFFSFLGLASWILL